LWLQAEHEKLRLEIERLTKDKLQAESPIKLAKDEEVIQFSVGQMFKNNPPSNW